MSTPDISVIVAVYNAMPHLRDTLASLERQTIGFGRMEVLLVDDGSTDGSSDEVEAFARRHPDAVRTRRQENSGTPAVPFNRGLEMATGRYVFFLGADDYLADQALERMVEAADEWESDLLAEWVVGVGERSVNQRLYRPGTQPQVDPFDSPLPYNLSNSKMFRRELVERHGLRFREDMRSHCDQPFTFRAIMHARRVSVLADEPLYFGVQPETQANVTKTARPEQMLFSKRVILETIAEHLPPGPERDVYVRRQLEWDLAALLNPSVLDLAPEARQAIYEGVGELAREYLHDDLLPRINVRERLRLVLARENDLDLLTEVIASIRATQQSKVHAFLELDARRAFMAHPGYGSPSTRREWYELHTERVQGRLESGLETSVRTRRRYVQLTCRLRVHGLTPKHVVAGPAEVSVKPAVDGDVVTLRFPREEEPRLRLRIVGRTYDLPVEADS